MSDISLAARTDAATAPAIATPMGMIERALSTGASVETIQKLMELQERWEANQARRAFNDAISAAKAEMPEIVKNNTVDFTTPKGRTHYKFEDLASIMRQIQPILSKHGLSVRYRTSSEPSQPVVVTCIISHKLGHSEENSLMAGRDDTGNKNSIQSIGSTVTYLQRYTLKAALGLAAAADDDANRNDAPSAITDDEQKIVLALIEETGSDIAKFCEVLDIDSVTKMPQAKFKRAIAMLESKKRQAAKNA